MMENSITKFCMAACIFMLLVSLSMNFVVALDIPAFTHATNDPYLTNDSKEIAEQVSPGVIGLVGGNIWTIITGTLGGATLVGAVILMWYATKTGSWNLVAAYLFGMIFFTSWTANIGMLNSYGGILDSFPVVNTLFLMITVVMVFLFAGAAIGILGGND